MPVTSGFTSRQDQKKAAEPPTKKKKPPYRKVLRFQRVPMDIAAISASLTAANS